MDEVFLQALVNRAKEDSTFIDKLPDDVKQEVSDKLNEENVQLWAELNPNHKRNVEAQQ